MNNIKPRWIVFGFVVVGALWLMETSNRPDAIPDYTVQGDSHLRDDGGVFLPAATPNRKHRTASIPYEPVSAQSVDPLSVVDQQVAEQKKVKPLTARMMVANRGEFFAVNSMALPAQERTKVVDMGYSGDGSKEVARKREQCEFKDCTGLGATDY